MGGGTQQATTRTLAWFQDDDPEGDLIGSQSLHMIGVEDFDDFNQGTWTIAYIGPYYAAPVGTAGPARSLLNGPIGGLGLGIPWWWLAGQHPAPPLPPDPAVQPGVSGAAQPFYY